MASDISSSLPYSINTDNTGAYPGFSDQDCDVDATARGLWYAITPTSNDILEVSIANQAFPAGISVFTGTCGSLTCLAKTYYSYSDQSLQFAAASASTYYILVSGDEFDDFGSLTVSVEALADPGNEECALATDISSFLPYSINTDNTGAYPGFSDQDCDVDATARGLWYAITPTSNFILEVSITNQAFPAGISVFTGTYTCGSLTCLAKTYYSYSDQSLQIAAASATTYYILISGDDFNDFGSLTVSVEALADPGNEECALAIVISSSLPYSINTDNTGAYPGFSDQDCDVDATARGLWYAVTPTSNDILEVSIANQAFPAGISVFTGTCGSLTCLAKTSYFDQSLQFAAASATTYYILFSGDDFNDFGSLTVSVEALDAGNEECALATDISSSLPYSINTDNTGAYPGFSDQACDVDATARGLWYAITPTSNDILEVSITNQAFPAGISVFTGTCGSLTCLVKTSYYSNFDQSLQFAAASATTYYILFSGDDFNDFGSLTVSVEALDAGNEECALATDISSSLPYSINTDNTGAYPGFSDQDCDVDATARGLWYAVTPTSNFILEVSIANQAFPAGISVFTGTCGSLTCLAKTSYYSFWEYSLQFAAASATTYYILISGEDFFDFGTFDISVQVSGRIGSVVPNTINLTLILNLSIFVSV
jgi:hypothetical protein